ncbi:uncharacterized protein ACWYII_009156 [Salvelinus alpinus]
MEQVLVNTLDELTSDEMKRFQWLLIKHQRRGYKPISKSELDRDTRRENTVELMVNKYRENGALGVTIHILKDMHQNKLADELKTNANILKGAEKSTAAKSTAKESIAAKSTATKSTGIVLKRPAKEIPAAKGTAAKGTAAKGTAAKGTAAKGTAAKGTAAKGTAKKTTAATLKRPAKGSSEAKRPKLL